MSGVKILLVGLVMLAACGGVRSHVPAEGDGVVLQKVLDGALPAKEGFAEITQAGGLPIATSKGFLFVVADGGLGPYSVTSPSHAFLDTPLKTEHGVGWALVPVAAPDGATYRFVTHFGDSGPDKLAHRFLYPHGDEVSYVTMSGPHLDRWPSIGDANVAPRTLRVWVPAQPPTHFMYAHDGQNLFDPAANFNGWWLQEAAGPATLVVGIDNGSARLDEYTPSRDVINGQPVGGKGDLYTDFVELTVRPFIEAHYGKPKRSGVMGSSLGGVIAYEQVLRHPGTWDFVASLSGTMGWGSIGPTTHNPTLIQLYAALPACPAPTFYLDSGGGPGSGCIAGEGEVIRDDSPDPNNPASDNYCENAQLNEALVALGCGPRLTYKWAPGAQHAESYWRGRAPGIFRLFESL